MARLNTGLAAAVQQRNPRVAAAADAGSDLDSDALSVASSDPISSAREGSDKENSTNGSRRHPQKRKSGNTGMSDRGVSSRQSSKRRRTEEQSSPRQSRVALREEINNRVDRNYYDPDQDAEQVRSSRRQYRDLISRVNDSRSEFLQAKSQGIEKTLAEADALFDGVKQTSVATIDSRLLVSVGDLANRKVSTLALGDSTIGIDVEDFITKCISFMKRSDEVAGDDFRLTQSSQRQRRRRPTATQNDEDDEDEDDPMNWAYLGTNLCFPSNSRPCVSGFLLGPLSVQKKVRQATQRRAKQTQSDPSQAARPTELNEEDLEKQESANLTVICGDINRLLSKTIVRGQQKITEEYSILADNNEDGEEPSQAELQELMTKHGLTDNGCVPLFNFCVNPRSFGQTVENMFYVSFLIKEGKVGLDFDSNGLPTLGTAEAKSLAERQETQRNQAVFTLDFDMWTELVDSFGIEKSIIPHRADEDWDDGTIDRDARGFIAADDDDDYE